MTTKHYVCRIDDLPLYMGVAALVQNEQVAIFKLDPAGSHICAISNYDPFSQTCTLSRGITGELQGNSVVAAPMYKQHFNLNTGECLEDTSVRVRVYPVVVEQHSVYIVS